MMPDTRKFIAEALREAAERWDEYSDPAYMEKNFPSFKPETRQLLTRRWKSNALIARGFAEALENGRDL